MSNNKRRLFESPAQAIARLGREIGDLRQRVGTFYSAASKTLHGLVLRVTTAYSQKFLATNLGGEGAPTFSWEGDSDTGIYSTGSDSIGVTAGSNKILDIDGAGNALVVRPQGSYEGVVIQPDDDSVSRAALSIRDDTGAYTTEWRFDGQIRVADGSEGAPAYTFLADQDTGMYRPTTNELDLVSGGTTRARLDSQRGVKNAISYQGGFENYGGSFDTGAYYKSIDGVVHLQGLVRKTGSSSTWITQLPTGYRPPGTLIVMVIASIGGTTWGRLNIRSNGILECSTNIASGTGWISLSGISFIAASAPE